MRRAARLAGVLERYTSAHDRCWFAVWNGFGHGYLAFDPAGLPVIKLPDREMVLLCGSLSAAASNLAAEPWEQSANLWWPDDRAWCVATDLDFKSTYIGGAQPLINALLRDDTLEPNQGVGMAGGRRCRRGHATLQRLLPTRP